MIAGEVLAVSFGPGDGAGDAGAGGGPGVAGPWHAHADTDLGLRFWLAVAAPDGRPPVWPGEVRLAGGFGGELGSEGERARR